MLSRSSSTAILGISAFYHDAAAALVVDGEIVAAAQEERFTRRKHDPSFPANAIRYCLDEVGLAPEQLDYVGFYEKPLLKLERLLDTYLSYAPRGFRSFLQFAPAWAKHKLHLRREIANGLSSGGGVPEADRLHRAPRVSCGKRVLPLSIREGRDSHHGRRGRVGDHHLGRGKR